MTEQTIVREPVPTPEPEPGPRETAAFRQALEAELAADLPETGRGRAGHDVSDPDAADLRRDRVSALPADEADAVAPAQGRAGAPEAAMAQAEDVLTAPAPGGATPVGGAMPGGRWLLGAVAVVAALVVVSVTLG